MKSSSGIYTPSVTAILCKFDISLLKNTKLNVGKNEKPRAFCEKSGFMASFFSLTWFGPEVT